MEELEAMIQRCRQRQFFSMTPGRRSIRIELENSLRFPSAKNPLPFLNHGDAVRFDPPVDSGLKLNEAQRRAITHGQGVAGDCGRGDGKTRRHHGTHTALAGVGCLAVRGKHPGLDVYRQSRGR